MVINLTGVINEDMFNDFIERLRDYTMNDKPLTQIMLNSSGGDIMVADALCELIEDIQIPLVAYKQISSAALYLFMKCKVERRIVKNTYGVYHRASMNVTTNEDGSLKHGSKSIIEAIQKVDTDSSLQEEWMNITKEERKRVYENDGDLGLDTARLNIMLENSIESDITEEQDSESATEMLKVAKSLLDNIDKSCKEINARGKKRKKSK